MHPSREVVHAVIVTFHPDEISFMPLLSELAIQTSRVHVVDNTPEASPVRDWISEAGSTNVEYHALGKNLGIATALNEGMRQAMAQGATHVLLSDQDSLPERRMVHGLLHALAGLQAQGIRAGAVGPTFTDRNTGITFPFQSRVPGKFFYGHAVATDERPIVEALTLITSGKLIPVEALRDVGLMREDLFIDDVDIEWCLRARTCGWRMFGTCMARMSHAMGESDLDVWYFGWRKETNYSPLRVYYRTRNYVALCREKGIDLRWKVRNGWYTFGVVYSQVFFGKHGREALRMALRGLRDGVRNRMGRYEPG
jgi:rhamnosyltransferase